MLISFWVIGVYIALESRVYFWSLSPPYILQILVPLSSLLEAVSSDILRMDLVSSRRDFESLPLLSCPVYDGCVSLNIIWDSVVEVFEALIFF